MAYREGFTKQPSCYSPREHDNVDIGGRRKFRSDRSDTGDTKSSLPALKCK